MTTVSELMNAVHEDNKRKQAMLKSMATSFRSGLQFSFYGSDMADLLDELREEHVDHMVNDD